MTTTDSEARDSQGLRYVTLDEIAETAREYRDAHSLDGYSRGSIRAARTYRNLLVKRALRQGMHPAAVARCAELSERYVRSLVPASER